MVRTHFESKGRCVKCRSKKWLSVKDARRAMRRQQTLHQRRSGARDTDDEDAPVDRRLTHRSSHSEDFGATGSAFVATSAKNGRREGASRSAIPTTPLP